MTPAEGATVFFDEKHRIGDPSLVLKIGVDEYPRIKILATGSSTLGDTEVEFLSVIS